MSENSRLYLYRVLDLDEDGDPLDHGVVRAVSVDAAARYVGARLREIFEADCQPMTVRFYALRDRKNDGVLGGDDDGHDDRVLP